MTDEIKLGELEFIDSDRDFYVEKSDDKDFAAGTSFITIEKANRILREKIEQLDIIYHRCRGTYSCIHEKGLWSSGRSGGTIKSHRARILLIEELPK